jgi:hypothetical protein
MEKNRIQVEKIFKLKKNLIPLMIKLSIYSRIKIFNITDIFLNCRYYIAYVGALN